MKVSRTWLAAGHDGHVGPVCVHRRRWRRRERRRCGELDAVRLQLQWVPQAQFAGYFAAAGARATTRTRASTVDVRRRRPRRHPAAGRARRRTAPSSRSAGCRRCSRRARTDVRPRQHRADLPALRHAVGGVGRLAASRRPRTSRARRSASGTSATSSRSSAAARAAGLEPDDGLRGGHPAVRHDAAALTAARRRTTASTSPRR